jgi:HlyD family secretion protein
MNDLFRKNALDQLSSPEQLDQLMQVTDRKAWLVLSGLAILLSTALLWSLLGAIPTRVAGPCILVKTSGVDQIVSQGAGQIESLIPLKSGDQVIKGQKIATV